MSEILDGKVIKPGNPLLHQTRQLLDHPQFRRRPTPDKPEVLLETPPNLNRVNSFLNLRVADIWACYKEWRERATKVPSFSPSPSTTTAGNGAATCAIRTAT